ncbi:BQ5605_C014g07551 [Microbotryum silenes-dioicae]|uniref:Anaphase-promoting complex subunit 11 n=1 Tax=Microbotryum silenes-dioicae TaxID=796604 RepID=A0A2X0NY73_9BASI|nr:BQ5605_C014g07551 [Microbotryum silenes-dioicae]
MKITVNSYHGIALWRWNLQPPTQRARATTTNSNPTSLDPSRVAAAHSNPADDEAEEEEDENDDDDDVCGICRVAYDGCCPDCKTPGDACPLVWGECTHVFHMHCLLKWINTESSKQQCPMDRRPWVTLDASNLPTTTNVPVPPVGLEAVQQPTPHRGAVVHAGG